MLREFGASISDDTRLGGCGRKIRLPDASSTNGFREQTVWCRRNWLCPTCGYVAACAGSAKLGQQLVGWTSQDHDVALLTLTQTHDVGARLAVLWDRLEDGWTGVVRGPAWRRDRDIYGARGYVRIVEVVHHPTTGWNAHLHALLLLDTKLAEPNLDDLKASLAGRFTRRICSLGGQADISGQNLKTLVPGTEEQLAAYCLKGNKPIWSDGGSRSPMAILADISTTGQGMQLWKEFTAAVTDRRRMQLAASKAINSLCGT